MIDPFADTKSPVESVVYAIDYSAQLPSGVTISSSKWISRPSSLTLSQSAYTTLESKVMASGGTHGTTYKLINQVGFSDGQVRESVIELTVAEK